MEFIMFALASDELVSDKIKLSGRKEKIIKLFDYYL